MVVAAEQAAVFRSRVPSSPYSLQVWRGDVFRVRVRTAEIAEKYKCGDDEKENRDDNDKALGQGQYGRVAV